MKWRRLRKSCELLRTLLDRTSWCTTIGISISIGIGINVGIGIVIKIGRIGRIGRGFGRFGGRGTGTAASRKMGEGSGLTSA